LSLINLTQQKNYEAQIISKNNIAKHLN